MSMQNIEKENIRSRILPMKGAFSRIGWGLVCCVAGWIGSSSLISYLLREFAPELTRKYSTIFNALMMFIPLYLIGIPLFLLCVKGLPQFKIPFAKSKRIRAKDFVLLLVCGLGCSYVLNFVTVMINALLLIIFGDGLDSMNNTSNVYGNNYLLGLITVGVLAPVLEEYFFRGVLINKLRPYGEGICILASGFLFGMLHSNFPQIPYATALGLVFAFVTIRTGTILYSTIMHIIVNCYAVTISQLLTNSELSMGVKIAFTVLIVLITFTVLGVGVTFTAIKAKRCRINGSTNYLPDGTPVKFGGTVKSFFSSSGVIGYIVIIAVMVVINFVAAIK